MSLLPASRWTHAVSQEARQAFSAPWGKFPNWPGPCGEDGSSFWCTLRELLPKVIFKASRCPISAAACPRRSGPAWGESSQSPQGQPRIPPKIQKCIRSGRNLYRGQFVVQTSQFCPSIGVSNYEEDGGCGRAKCEASVRIPRVRKQTGMEMQNPMALSTIPATDPHSQLQRQSPPPHCAWLPVFLRYCKHQTAVRQLQLQLQLQFQFQGPGLGASHALSRWLSSRLVSMQSACLLDPA